MTITIKVGKIEISSDASPDTKTFVDLIDQLAGARLTNLINADQRIENIQAAAAPTVAAAAATPATSAVQTVTTV